MATHVGVGTIKTIWKTLMSCGMNQQCCLEIYTSFAPSDPTSGFKVDPKRLSKMRMPTLKEMEQMAVDCAMEIRSCERKLRPVSSKSPRCDEYTAEAVCRLDDTSQMRRVLSLPWNRPKLDGLLTAHCRSRALVLGS